MERPTPTRLRIGAWCLDPTSGDLSRDGQTARLEARTLRLLLCLAERAGEVVSIDDLLDRAWAGVAVSSDSVYQAVTSLRRVLGDDTRQPTYIETVPRLGYRMVAAVGPWTDAPVPRTDGPPSPRRRAARSAAAAALLLAAVGGFLFYARSRAAVSPVTARAQPSIAVLPFLDLTDAMNEEPFADGMTAELIDRLSKIPGLRVHAPMPPSRAKGKELPVPDMAKMLGVGYVLEGSVRRSGARLRVAARLLRGDDEYVVWSETYDRPADDVLRVQDDIAGEVTRALRTSIKGPA